MKLGVNLERVRVLIAVLVSGVRARMIFLEPSHIIAIYVVNVALCQLNSLETVIVVGELLVVCALPVAWPVPVDPPLGMHAEILIFSELLEASTREVQLAHSMRAVSVISQPSWQRRESLIEIHTIVQNTMSSACQTCEHGGPGWHTDRVSAVAVPEKRSFSSDTIDIGCFYVRVPHAPEVITTLLVSAEY